MIDETRSNDDHHLFRNDARSLSDIHHRSPQSLSYEFDDEDDEDEDDEDEYDDLIRDGL